MKLSVLVSKILLKAVKEYESKKESQRFKDETDKAA